MGFALREKCLGKFRRRPELVAELLSRLTHGGPFRRAVLASQARAIAEIRATDFGALLRERLLSVLEGAAPPAGTASAVPGVGAA